MKKRILIADDCKDFVWLLVQFFKKYAEIEVVGIAYDGDQAIEMVRQMRPDILLIDLIMPSMDGVEVLKKLQQEMNELSIIVISAINIDQLMNNVMGLGIMQYFVKPVDFNDILTTIKMKNNR